MPWRSIIGWQGAVNIGCQCESGSSEAQACGVQIIWCIDAAGGLINLGNRDDHAGFDRPQLFQPFGQFQR